MISNRVPDQVQRATESLAATTHAPPDIPGQTIGCIHLLSTVPDYTPSREQIVSTYLQGVTGRNVPKSKPVHALNLDVLLSPTQARTGGHLPVRIPLFNLCPTCEGTGRAGFFLCDQCGGQGISEDYRTIDVQIPRMLQQEMLIPLDLRSLGVSNMHLTLRIRPSEDAF